MSRKGQLWRGELAQRIETFLAGDLSLDELMDWVIDHPFFEDRSELDSAEQRLIAGALATVMQLAPAEPEATRTGDQDLKALIASLWDR